MNEGYEVVEQRMDAVDRHRRTWTWLGAVAAVLVAGLVFLLVLRPAGAPVAPAQPGAGSGIVFRSLVFDRPFSLRLPGWYAEIGRDATTESEQRVVFNRCPGDPVCVGLDVYAFTPDRAPGGSGTRAGVLARYESLAAEGSLRIRDRGDRLVGGLPATTFAVTVTHTVDEGLGCFDNGTCEGFYERNEARYAVIDAPGGLVVVGMRTFADNPRAAEWLAEFDGVLDGMRFGADREPAPSPAPRTELSGVWRATLARADLVEELTAAGFAQHVDRVVAELPRAVDGTWTLEMWIDSTTLRTSVITPDGVPVLVDTRLYSWDGSRLTLVSQDGAYTTVLETDRSDGTLRLSPMSATGPLVDGFPSRCSSGRSTRRLRTAGPADAAVSAGRGVRCRARGPRPAGRRGAPG
jgi:hypothetical protein